MVLTRVLEQDDGLFVGLCEMNHAGKPMEEFPNSAPCGFRSSDWPTRELAQARIDLHEEEHETGEPMQELSEFLGEHRDELDEALAASTDPEPEED